MITRLFFTIATAVALPAFAQQETWQLDPAHSAAQFSVRHMGISTVRGAFTKLSGSVSYDPAEPKKSSISVAIDASSVDTRVQMRDNDLRSENFLDVKKYPEITFKSVRIERGAKGGLKAIGDLTIHGVTKQVALDIDGLSQPMKDPRGNLHMGASAATTINRNDFGVSGAPGMVGSDIAITIDVELVRSGSSS
ncbi:MAG TPA: YceI family protein [Bryobacteraceae bacterium]|nr:YceI family protein [Bryobacteraceae bacterium]